MAAARLRRKYEAVDYSRRPGDRRRMTHYLRAGGFRRVAGMAPVGHAVRRNRVIMAIVAVLVFGVGIYFVVSG